MKIIEQLMFYLLWLWIFKFYVSIKVNPIDIFHPNLLRIYSKIIFLDTENILMLFYHFFHTR